MNTIIVFSSSTVHIITFRKLNNPSDSSTWTYDEGEEMHKDISDLQDKMVTKDVLEAMVEGLKGEMEGLIGGMEGLKEEIMEGVKGLLMGRLIESDKASHEIHDEDTRKVNHDWRNSGFGFKTNHIPKIDMRKFDGKDPITWILQMEQFFDLHDVPHTQKV